MILVTLGTHPKPMNRLVLELDRIAHEEPELGDVVITAAAFTAEPMHARAIGIAPYDLLVEMVEAADAVVTHGGPASIALAFAYGHSPIIVPRDPHYGEHVDDHQIRFALWLSVRRNVTVVRDVGDLEAAIRNAVRRERDQFRTTLIPMEAVSRLRAIIDR